MPEADGLRMGSQNTNLRSVHDCAEPELVVVMIHGTWASKTDWTESYSPIGCALLKEFGGKNVAITEHETHSMNS
jgi:hypothetical protein